ncbi:MAG: UDP-N-acetylmuramate dehydrogenase [Endomicrobiales bacterium]|nr:UDP-N-acetylmuramate dehydrogenase [Endomicrobiales bacterium]
MSEMFGMIPPTNLGLLLNEPISKHTTFGVGGNTKYFVRVSNTNELLQIINYCIKEKIKYFVLGSGSNVLFNDAPFNGIVIKLGCEFNNVSVDGQTIVAGAGAQLSLVVRKAAENGLTGLEFASAIPGTVGGAVFGNAGTKDEWISEVLQSVSAVLKNGSQQTFQRSEMQFAYRTCAIENVACFTQAVFGLKTGVKNDIFQKIKDFALKKSLSQPLGTKNAGSIFKNPAGAFAGRLIEQAGLKGFCVGGARISYIHANFIENENNAKAADILALIKIVQDKVLKKFNIKLETEIKIVE